MLFSKLLVDASDVRGKANVLVKDVTAEGTEEFLNILAEKLKVEREGLDFEVYDDDAGWCSVAELTAVDAGMAKVRLFRHEPVPPAAPMAPEPMPSSSSPENAAIGVTASTAEDGDDNVARAAEEVEKVVEAPAPVQPSSNIPNEWKEACENANNDLAEANVKARLTLVFARGQGSYHHSGHGDLMVRCSACKKMLQTGGGRASYSLNNAKKHARDKHGPTSLEAYAANAAPPPGTTRGPKRTYDAVSGDADNGDQKGQTTRRRSTTKLWRSWWTFEARA